MTSASGYAAATARAFASARRNAVSAGRSPLRGVSSTSGATLVNGKPKRWRSAWRWRELEARTRVGEAAEVIVFKLFFDSERRAGYYLTFASAALSCSLSCSPPQGVLGLERNPGGGGTETMVNRDPGLARAGRFDAFRMAAEGDSLGGEFDASTLARVVDRLAPGAGPAPIAWRIAGDHDAFQRPMLSVTIEGSLPLVCQRCLQPFAAPIAQQTRLLLAQDETQLGLLDAEDPEVVLAATPIDARTLVEDEILLSLPLAPRHAEGQCPEDVRLQVERPEAGGTSEASPFAPLAKLKKRGLRNT